MKSQFVVFLILLLDLSSSNNLADTTQQQWTRNQITLTEYGKQPRRFKLRFFAANDNETASIEMNYPAFASKFIQCKSFSNQQEMINGKLSTTST